MLMNEGPNDLSRRGLLIGAGAGLSLAVASVALAANSSARKKDAPWIPSEEFMADVLPLFMRLETLPGLSIAVVEDASVVWSRAVGVSNVETKEAVRTATPFEAASMGKPVFVYVVMKLVEEGLLDLDRPLVQYMPRPSFIASDDPNIDKITVRDVVRHSTGLPNWSSEPD